MEGGREGAGDEETTHSPFESDPKSLPTMPDQVQLTPASVVHDAVAVAPTWRQVIDPRERDMRQARMREREKGIGRILKYG
jgi:hypothetical protein